MNLLLKRMSAFLIAAATLSSIAAPIGEGVSAAGISMSPVTFTCPSSYIPGKTSFNVEISKSNDTYYLCRSKTFNNEIYNIKLVNYKWQSINRGNYAVPSTDQRALQYFNTDKPNGLEQQQLATLYNVEGVYDWYSSNFGYNGFGTKDSNNENTLYVFMFTEPNMANSGVCDLYIDGNMTHTDPSNKIPFSMVGFSKQGMWQYQPMMAADRDVVGHEMTHVVLMKQLGWIGSTNKEGEALMEAYCDILGELSDDNCDWKIGNDIYSGSYCLRDLANPTATQTPDTSGKMFESNFYTNYLSFKKDLDTYAVNENMDDSALIRTTSTLGSTVVSHTAYLMNKYGISRNDLAQIWYRSISFYNSGSLDNVTFKDCRKAVTSAALMYYLSKNYSGKNLMEKLEIINNAFDSSNIDTRYNAISYPKTYTTVRQNAAAYPSNMAGFVRTESQKYRNDNYWNTDDVNTYSGNIIDIDNDIYFHGITVGPTFYKGFDNRFDYVDEEPYYQCAGFAKKLQLDYYGTTKFLQLNNSSDYSPRIGDHLRVVQPRNPLFAAHSIFITGVSGSSITYADCNSDNHNKIAWSKSGTITNNNGNLSISLDGSSYNFVWVERPIMIGDVNGDSYVNQSDVTLIKSIASNANYNPTGYCDISYRNFAADVNKDGRVNSSDTTSLTNAVKNKAGITYEFIK